MAHDVRLCAGQSGCRVASALFAFLFCAAPRADCGRLDRYLAPARFVDSGHPRIVATARWLTLGGRTDVDRARALYEFVRDGNTPADCTSYVASDVLGCGGNLCYQRAILLAALARAAGIPARLQLQKVTIDGYRGGREPPRRIVFAHGVTSLFVGGRWTILEPVGNAAKWRQWTEEERRGDELPLPFVAGRDCLFRGDARIRFETLAPTYADRTPEMEKVISGINRF